MCCLNFIDLRGRRLVLRTFELKCAEATLQVDITFHARSCRSQCAPPYPAEHSVFQRAPLSGAIYHRTLAEAVGKFRNVRRAKQMLATSTTRRAADGSRDRAERVELRGEYKDGR
jgi:hypothetical protein